MWSVKKEEEKIARLFFVVLILRSTASNFSERSDQTLMSHGIDTFDRSVVICNSCNSHLAQRSSQPSWTQVRVEASKNGKSFKNVYESDSDVDMNSLTVRNPLFLHQSPCILNRGSKPDGHHFTQVTCNSRQSFSCDANSNLRSHHNQTASEQCENTGVCWSEDVENPVPGCLPRPVPGTTGRYSVSVGNRIVNGEDADITDHPWAVYLEIAEAYLCGGSILAAHLIVTARHCLEGFVKDKLKIVVGHTDASQASEPFLDASKYNIYFHPNESVDISLIKLKDPLSFSSAISPIALPVDSQQHPSGDEWVTAIGWGLACANPPTCTEQTVFPDHLQSVNIKTSPREECLKKYGDDNVTVTEAKKYFSFCAGGPLYDKEAQIWVPKDACDGDSGGALECTDKTSGKKYLCGLTEFGPPSGMCGMIPGVYVMISHPDILPYLQQQVSNESVWEGGLAEPSPDRAHDNQQSNLSTGAVNPELNPDVSCSNYITSAVTVIYLSAINANLFVLKPFMHQYQ